MSQVRFEECKSKPGYFAMFLAESGKAKRPGLGDRLAGFFAWLGIRKREGCGCEQRQAWLNRLGQRIAALFGR